MWNLGMVFGMYQVARAGYWAENASELHYTQEVFWGGLVFDTSAILYTNALWIVMVLFPRSSPILTRVWDGRQASIEGAPRPSCPFPPVRDEREELSCIRTTGEGPLALWGGPCSLPSSPR